MLSKSEMQNLFLDLFKSLLTSPNERRGKHYIFKISYYFVLKRLKKTLGYILFHIFTQKITRD